MRSVERSRPVRGQGPRAARAAQELTQPPKTANVEILGGHFAGAQHGPDELPASIHRPERGIILRGLSLQPLKVKRLALPGDGSLMIAHWPGPEEGKSCCTVPSIVRCGTRMDNRREGARRGRRRAWAWVIPSLRDVRGPIACLPGAGAGRRIGRRCCRTSTPSPRGRSASEHHPAAATRKCRLPGRHCRGGPLIGAIRGPADETKDGHQAGADDGNDCRVLDERLPSLVAAGERAYLNHVMTPVRALRLFEAVGKRRCPGPAATQQLSCPGLTAPLIPMTTPSPPCTWSM